MAKHKFTPSQRHAVFTVHGERCYMCGDPLNLKTMEVDHVIPESLLSDPTKLAQVLRDLGRPEDFNLNTFSNWMPACRPCNGLKSSTVFEPSLKVQLLLQNAAKKAPEAERIAAKTVSDRELYEVLNLLERANENGTLTEEFKNALQPLIAFQVAVRQPEVAGEPVRLTPLYEVLSEAGGIRLIHGPYGVGARPSTPDAHSSFDCPNCGSIGAWNGARCVICGQMSDA